MLEGVVKKRIAFTCLEKGLANPTSSKGKVTLILRQYWLITTRSNSPKRKFTGKRFDEHAGAEYRAP